MLLGQIGGIDCRQQEERRILFVWSRAGDRHRVESREEPKSLGSDHHNAAIIRLERRNLRRYQLGNRKEKALQQAGSNERSVLRDTTASPVRSNAAGLVYQLSYSSRHYAALSHFRIDLIQDCNSAFLACLCKSSRHLMLLVLTSKPSLIA